jgi:hypothetical protein
VNIKRVLKKVFKSVNYVILFIACIPVVFIIWVFYANYFPKEQSPEQIKCFREIEKSFIPLCDAWNNEDNELIIKLKSDPIPDSVRLACADVKLDTDGIDNAYRKYQDGIFGSWCDDG